MFVVVLKFFLKQWVSFSKLGFSLYEKLLPYLFAVYIVIFLQRAEYADYLKTKAKHFACCPYWKCQTTLLFTGVGVCSIHLLNWIHVTDVITYEVVT